MVEVPPIYADEGDSLADDVIWLIDPQHRGRQFVAAEVSKLSDTRAAKFVLEPAEGHFEVESRDLRP